MLRDTRIMWGDAKTRKAESVAVLGDALALQHGAQSSAFFKQSARLAKKDHDWLCFSIVFKERTLDFAADSLELLLDWYLAIASLVPHSNEPLLDEAALRARLERMMSGRG